MFKKVNLLCTRMILAVLALIALAAVGSFSGTAWAKDYTANNITVTVPGGWSTEYNAEEMQILLITPQQEFVVGIQVLETHGLTAQEFAAEVSKGLQGTNPLPVKGFGQYAFDAKIMKLDAHITTLEHEGLTLMVCEIGNRRVYAKTVNSIWTSLRSSDKKTQALFDQIPKSNNR